MADRLAEPEVEVEPKEDEEWRPRCEAVTCYRLFAWNILYRSCKNVATWIAYWPCGHYEFVCDKHKAWHADEYLCLRCGKRFVIDTLTVIRWEKI